jgi:hypothetical protein
MITKRGLNKRGQLMLFVIIAIVIIAIILLVVLLPKSNKTKIQEQITDPNAYLQDCINTQLEPIIDSISEQGGYLDNNGLCIVHHSICRHYLCYQTVPYQTCINQEPLLQEHITNLIKTKLQQGIISGCISKFSESARKKGYDISSCNSPSFSVNLTSGQVSIPFTCSMTLTKGQETNKFEKFNSVLNSPLYDFVSVVKEIINDEITKGDFDQVPYMLSHNWLSIEKFRTTDGSKIYTIKSNTNKEFVFAVRNNWMPPGVIPP